MRKNDDKFDGTKLFRMITDKIAGVRLDGKHKRACAVCCKRDAEILEVFGNKDSIDAHVVCRRCSPERYAVVSCEMDFFVDNYSAIMAYLNEVSIVDHIIDKWLRDAIKIHIERKNYPTQRPSQTTHLRRAQLTRDFKNIFKQWSATR